MVPPNTPSYGTDADEAYCFDLTAEFILPSVLPNDSDVANGATNLKTPKTVVEDANRHELSTYSCSGEGSVIEKDKPDGPIQFWVLYGTNDDRVIMEKKFYPQSARKDGVLWRYTYANGAEKKVRLDQKPTHQRLTEMTPAVRVFADGSCNNPDNTVERWAINAIYASGREKRLFPESAYANSQLAFMYC